MKIVPTGFMASWSAVSSKAFICGQYSLTTHKTAPPFFKAGSVYFVNVDNQAR